MELMVNQQKCLRGRNRLGAVSLRATNFQEEKFLFFLAFAFNQGTVSLNTPDGTEIHWGKPDFFPDTTDTPNPSNPNDPDNPDNPEEPTDDR